MAFQGDVPVIESENDSVVPHAVITYVEACTQAHSLTSRVIQGTDHGLSDEGAQHSYTSLLVNWMTVMLQGARAGNKVAPTNTPQSSSQESA